MKIRIKFAKEGTMKFIGHLDVMRYFQKVMRRADVDIRYSEGFSPHQIMSFASPLGVGMESRSLNRFHIFINLVHVTVNHTDINKVCWIWFCQIVTSGIFHVFTSLIDCQVYPDALCHVISVTSCHVL